jgi:hypothetical protein
MVLFFIEKSMDVFKYVGRKRFQSRYVHSHSGLNSGWGQPTNNPGGFGQPTNNPGGFGAPGVGPNGGVGMGFNRWESGGLDYKSMAGFNSVDYSFGWNPSHDPLLRSKIDYVFKKYDF